MSKLNITYYNGTKDIDIIPTEISSDYCDIIFNITKRTTPQVVIDLKTATTTSIIYDKTELQTIKPRISKAAIDIDNEISLVNFSVIITEKNGKFKQILLEKEGITYLSTDQFFLLCERVFWKADDEIVFVIKVNDITKEFNLTVPRPEQPFKSWTWEDGSWNPPVPYPKDGKYYIWNEDKLNWELIDNV
jgi:hypothetical protein